jgi:hypothetical protein
LRSLWQQMIRYGRGRYRLIRKHPPAFSAAQVVPPLFVIWFALTGAGSFYSPYVSLMFLGTLLLYFTVVLGFSVGLAIRYGWRYLIQAPQVYAVIHFGLGAGFLMELVSSFFGRRKSRNKRINSVSANVEPSESAARNEVESNSKRAVAKGHEFAEHQVDVDSRPGVHHR